MTNKYLDLAKAVRGTNLILLSAFEIFLAFMLIRAVVK